MKWHKNECLKYAKLLENEGFEITINDLYKYKLNKSIIVDIKKNNKEKRLSFKTWEKLYQFLEFLYCFLY